MAQKQSIFGRITQLVRANINALIDQAEDPALMIDQLIRDYSANINEAEAAIAQTIGNLRMMEDDARQDEQDAREWGQKALAASQRADDFRTNGDTASADKFDNLAKVALSRQLDEEANVKRVAPQIEAQTKVVDQLKNGLDGMRAKLDQLSSKRDELAARAKSAEAQTKVNEALAQINVLDPTADLGRFEEKVRREEAKVRGQQELQASSLDRQFEQLEDLGQMTEVEARLAALKSGGQQAITQ
ncbi:PspA/IM30 family protein [Gulosibacter macacae]|uniref:PspA/IM30 family protein n=1 Tax=Gulosibacter macacae TaxID=2488791 RepID=A0A3P3W0U4_9MICO|nr:PspA/IM30 family protein [Gulosibacter macacae]RRJ88682.1 PspA/IM30 family protein [Gulosibacter macacae]